MLSILRKLKKKEDNRRGGAICNYATNWGNSLVTVQKLFTSDICSESALKIFGGRRHFGLDEQYSTWDFREQGHMLTMYVPHCVRITLAEMEFVVLGWLFWVICSVLLFMVRFDFYLLGGLFISLFDMGIRSQTHKVGGP